ncbi:iron-containing alcohol dehydrogenase [Virgibacillus halodenitrificans]|uniref:Iron-containing alcohol dehydrogenase n=1 Tax=Virgibacillus halodenitrificans TaxID=1482 RepID=A0ABR7VHK2_VIRHA|nr:iron-containing alcohol dehydrogenase [Virgibacillus halodenitrificans]MBD1221156.1 iron-containing alcohol dehydrogenase [Virgibacillus halodenitrificans]
MSSTYLPRLIELGAGSLNKLGDIAKEQGIQHVIVIIDSFLTTPEIALDERLKGILMQKNIEVTYFSDYRGEPTTDHLEGALTAIEGKSVDGVLAIGGGSAIDIAKAVSLFAKTPTIKWEEIAAAERLLRLPLIAVPTTAGTGSEATKVMVIKDSKTEFKMNPGHKDLLPDVAVLDPELTLSLPKHFTAYTGMDALTHAMEAYVSTNASVTTDHYALISMKSIATALPKVYENGRDVEAREEMLLSSCYAGIAFSNASTNLAHAAGRPLGARFHIPHGLSVSLLLPFVMQFGLEVEPARYANVAVALGCEDTGDEKKLAASAVKQVEEWNEKFGIWQDGLKYIDIVDLKKNIPILVKDALSGNGITTNRKVPTEEDVATIFLELIEKLEEIQAANPASTIS